MTLMRPITDPVHCDRYFIARVRTSSARFCATACNVKGQSVSIPSTLTASFRGE
jgi:hypothetical protein